MLVARTVLSSFSLTWKVHMGSMLAFSGITIGLKPMEYSIMQ